MASCGHEEKLWQSCLGRHMTLTGNGESDQHRGLSTVCARKSKGVGATGTWAGIFTPSFIHSVALTRPLASKPQLHHL